MYSVLLTKKELRGSWKKQWTHFKEHFPAWSLSISESIAETPEFKSSQKVALFFPRAFEVDLCSLWHLKTKQVVFPRIDSKADKIRFFKVDRLEDLCPSKWGILEPPLSVENEVNIFENTDLILIPGMVFDEKGSRIGSGAGFYDRFLAKEGKHAKKWGVAFSPQVQKLRIAQEVFDIKMDALVTEKGIVYF